MLDVKAVINGFALLNKDTLPRITHCVDCDKKNPEARRLQVDCQRCRQCAAVFYRKKSKKVEIERTHHKR